jgi:hypothetical protein
LITIDNVVMYKQLQQAIGKAIIPIPHAALSPLITASGEARQSLPVGRLVYPAQHLVVPSLVANFIAYIENNLIQQPQTRHDTQRICFRRKLHDSPLEHPPFQQHTKPVRLCELPHFARAEVLEQRR